MNLQDELSFENVFIQPINEELLKSLNINLNVLRLDKLHKTISGNKWFKLKYYLQQAIENNCNSVATFGGAFSNHIIAAAYACNKLNIQCTGFIRGNAAEQYSQTLLDATALNMKLEFINRERYKNKQVIIDEHASLYFIPEGGYGRTGAKGAAEILQLVPQLATYNYIICAVGTGTMLAGIANASLPHQQCIGISVMKNNFSLNQEVFLLTEKTNHTRIKVLHDYHFGGYAKHSKELLDFINKQWLSYQLPLDFVYTAKAYYAVYNLAEKEFFSPDSKILFIHSGGLQGNQSVKLLF